MGETLPLPVAPPEGPPLLTLQVVALLAAQERVVDWPEVIVAGLAANEAIAGAAPPPPPVVENVASALVVVLPFAVDFT